jgi:hypothetical protein
VGSPIFEQSFRSLATNGWRVLGEAAPVHRLIAKRQGARRAVLLRD